jgi:heat shock protein HslJ
LALLVLPGCAGAVPEGPLPPDLAGTSWLAATVAGQPVPADVAVTLEFPAADRIAGRSGCNRYSGPIGVVDGRLVIGPLAATRMACPPPQMTLETAFLGALNGASRLRRDNSALVVEPTDGGAPTRLRPFTPP